MLSSLKGMLGLAHEDTPDPCLDCQLKCVPATVTPHAWHVLVRLRPENPTDVVAWWPESLGGQLDPFAALLPDKKIKATAFEYPERRPFQEEAYVFNRVTSVHVVAESRAVLLEQVAQVVQDQYRHPPLEPSTLVFIVCAHRARDARCGDRGPGIARALTAADSSHIVLLSSHIGGHVYAGNVIVYGGISSGTWFGGVHERLVYDLLEGLREAEEKKCDPARVKKLRSFWRGTSGRSKEEQSAFFAECSRDIEDLTA